MSNRSLTLWMIGVALCCTHPFFAQSISVLQERLRLASTPGERWDLNYQLARNLLTTDLRQAAGYADTAVQLAVDMQDERKEAEASFVRGDIARRNQEPAKAMAAFERTQKIAADSNLLPLVLQSVEQLQDIASKQGNYKKAFQWSLERSNLLQTQARQYNEQQAQKQAATLADWNAQKKRETRLVLILMTVALALLSFFSYTRQRANRRLAGELAEKTALIEERRRRTEHLLLNILPKAVAAELTVRNKVAARHYAHTTVMFVDFVEFTRVAEQFSPEMLVRELDFCFSRFDDIIGRFRVEKIKTVGDAYICASGLTDGNESPVDMIQVALRMQDFLQNLKAQCLVSGRPFFEARIGIHFGPVVAGVVGVKKFAYDIWGDTVNTAARMEESCEPGRINVSGAAQAQAATAFQWQYRGKVAAKNKAEMDMYYVIGKSDLVPNK